MTMLVCLSVCLSSVPHVRGQCWDHNSRLPDAVQDIITFHESKMAYER